MTSGAFCRRSGDNLLCMAISTVNHSMSTIQVKEIIVVKGIHERVSAVMAGKTVLAKQGCVIRREVRLARCMAVDAVYQR
jgi:hypothetical protein